MKKSIFIGAMALITLAACQNESNELQNEVKKTEELQRGTEDLSDLAKEVVLADVNGYAAKLGPNSAFISCHDNYNNPNGNACVWVNGQQYNVIWTTMGEVSESGHIFYETNYYAEPASHCSC
ncbi:hypothetical protein V2E39_22775 [Chryseobacterium arthrosphaerae]|uniref:Lipoprotein n=1 Tax=Chryseobacterium arthrosphaerae TaxID=651561 RepID=A0ABU7R678_9FLAO